MYAFDEIINQYIKRLEEIKKHIEFISDSYIKNIEYIDGNNIFTPFSTLSN